MAELGLAFEVYLDAIAEEADRLASAVSGYLDKTVSNCPEWTGSDLVAHLTSVYRRWTAQVLARKAEERVPIQDLASKESNEIATDFDTAVADLLEVLGSAGPDAPCWNYTGENLETGWVARRLAHESAIHRVDAELLGEHLTRIDTELAADGLTERIVVLLPPRLAGGDKNLGGSLSFVCNDIETAFVVEVNNGLLHYRPQRGPSDCVVVGSASDLFLFSWNRLSPASLSITGDLEIVAAWGALSS